MTLPTVLEEALARPPGARFRRCALQVNPYPYVQRHDSSAAFPEASAYNRAIVAALVDQEIEMIGITDHDRTDDAGLRALAEAAGMVVFPGVEISSSEGVHVLVLFDPSTDRGAIEHFIGWCDVDVSPGCCAASPA